MPSLGETLRVAREKRGLTQTDIGHMVQTTQSLISDYERGVVKPGPDVLRRFVEAGLLTAEEALGLDAA